MTDPLFEENRRKPIGVLAETRGDLISWPTTLEALFWLGRTKSDWLRSQPSYINESTEKDIISLLSESKFGLLYNLKPYLGLVKPGHETHIDFAFTSGKTIDLKATEKGRLLVREMISPYSSGKFADIMVLAQVQIRLYDEVDLGQTISVENLNHVLLAGWVYDHEIVSKGTPVGPGTNYMGIQWKKKNYVLPKEKLWEMKDLGAVIGQEARVPPQRPLCEKLETPYYDKIRAMTDAEYHSDLVRRQRESWERRNK